MIILGLDPGPAITGYGLIKTEKNQTKLIKYGCITNPIHSSEVDRLTKIYQKLNQLLKKEHPNKIVLEKIFFFKNKKTVIEVSQTRGIILLLAGQHKIPLEEYTPLQIKQTITGYGRADKKQIQKMVKILLNLPKIPQPDDAADALAIALCGAYLNPVIR